MLYALVIGCMIIGYGVSLGQASMQDEPWYKHLVFALLVFWFVPVAALIAIGRKLA
jgi:hypothetical protein